MAYKKTINLIKCEIERCQKIVADNEKAVKSLLSIIDANKKSINEHKNALEIIEVIEDSSSE